MACDQQSCDVAVVGAGPGGIAAATLAAEQGAQVMLLDSRNRAGGQIWRGRPPATARTWMARAKAARVEHHAGCTVIDARGDAPGYELYATSSRAPMRVRAAKVILATGARERFLPFEGADRPEVTGVGGLQALVKDGLDVRGQRIAVVGSGPLLWAVAASLQEHGATVVLLAEQAPAAKVRAFRRAAVAQPGLWRQGASISWRLKATTQRLGTWPVAIENSRFGRGLTLHTQDDRGGAAAPWEVDRVACAFGLVPETGLARRLGASLRRDGDASQPVQVDARQSTSLAGLFCVGEMTGVGGAPLAIVEGQIAGAVAAGRPKLVERWLAQRERLRGWAQHIVGTFALREELRAGGCEQESICRCEEVSLVKLRAQPGPRAAKLLTRAGMGPCQGRLCGPALEALLGWSEASSPRAPLFPVQVGDLATLWRAPTETPPPSLPVA